MGDVEMTGQPKSGSSANGGDHAGSSSHSSGTPPSNTPSSPATKHSDEPYTPHKPHHNADTSKMGCAERWSFEVEGRTRYAFENLGWYIVRRPKTVIGIVIAITCLLLIGISNLESETNPERLFTPTDSEAVDVQDFQKLYFPSQRQPFDVYFTYKEGRPINLVDASLVKDTVREVIEIRSQILALNAVCDKRFDCEGRPITFRQVCTNGTILATGETQCLMTSVGDFFDNDPAVLASLSAAEVVERLSSENSTDAFGRPIARRNVMGGVEVDPTTGILTSVRAFALVGSLRSERVPVDGEQDTDPESFSMELRLDDAMWDVNVDTSYVTVFPNIDAAISEAASQALSSDFLLFGAGYVLLLIYTASVLSNRSWVRSRSALSFAVLISVMLSIGAAFGIVAALGVDYNNVVSALFVILLGLGVDDAFVIIDEYEAHGSKHKFDARVSKALGRAGSAILATSLTDMVAFAAGSSTRLPAIRSFCLYAAVGVLFDFAFQVTFFVACLVLDAGRQDSKTPDCLCCCRSVSKEETVPCCGLPFVKPKDKDFGDMSQVGPMAELVQRRLPAVSLHPVGKVVVLLIAATLVVIGAIGFTRMEVEFNFEWFIPDGNKVHKSLEVRDQFFARNLMPMSTFTGDVDYFVHRDDLVGLADAVQGCRAAVPGSMISWYDFFLLWLEEEGFASPSTADEFYNRIDQFLTTPRGETFQDNVVWRSPGDPTMGIVATEMSSLALYDDEGLRPVDFMDDQRACVSAFPNLQPRSWTFVFLFVEGLAIIEEETLRNVAIAAGCVFVVAIIVLADIWAATLILGTIACIDACLLGFLHWSGYTYNSVITVQVVLSIGLSVDYSMHILHGFLMSKSSTRDERARDALRTMGRPVVNGGITTFLAIVALAASASYVFEVFFVCFSLTILFGQFFGVVVLPVVLSLIGPASYEQRRDSPSDTDAPRSVKVAKASSNGSGAGAGAGAAADSDAGVEPVH